MAMPPRVQPIFLSFNYRITLLHHTYDFAILGAGYVCKLYLYIHWVIGLYRFTTVIGAQFLVQCRFVSSTFTKTGLHLNKGCTTLRAEYVSCFYLNNQWVTVNLWVFNLK